MGVCADVLSLAALLCPPSKVSLARYGAVLAELPMPTLQPTGSALPAVQGQSLLDATGCLHSLQNHACCFPCHLLSTVECSRCSYYACFGAQGRQRFSDIFCHVPCFVIRQATCDIQAINRLCRTGWLSSSAQKGSSYSQEVMDLFRDYWDTGTLSDTSSIISDATR